MRSKILRPLAPVTMLCLAACAPMPVPNYEANYDNVQQLKHAGAGSLAVAGVNAGAKAHDKGISVRGHQVVSPVGKGFADYVRDALEQELRRAELLSPDAPVKVAGTIVENDLDASSSAGTGTLAMEVTVTAGGVERFRKTVRTTTTWESSFVGAIAIPSAIQSYPKLVQTFLTSLYTDNDFIAAVKAPAAAATSSPPSAAPAAAPSAAPAAAPSAAPAPG